jgi:Tfp pilus assembly protein PilN
MDLIPEDYKRYLLQLHILQRWALVMFVLISLSISISFALDYKADEFQKEIVLLEQKKSISSQQRNILQILKKDHKKLLVKHNVLQKLRGGAAAENMFVTIDRAFDGNNVWFKNWRFERAGSKTSEPPKGVNTGYFIVIPESERINKKQQEAWKIQTHMEVNGGARDHEALASFVRRLLQQPQIGDVRILNTQQRIYVDTTVVDFSLVITVNSRYRSS